LSGVILFDRGSEKRRRAMQKLCLSAFLLALTFFSVHFPALAQRGSICVDEPIPGPIKGPIPRVKGMAIRTPTQEFAVLPGPAPLLVRICLVFRSYEIDVKSEGQSEAALVAPGSCFDLEGRRTVAKYTCTQDAAECQKRQAIPAYCNTKDGRRVAFRYWGLGMFAPYSSFRSVGKETGAFQVPVGTKQTAIAQLETPATYEVCANAAGSFELNVDGDTVKLADRCAVVRGKNISALRTQARTASGSFVRSDD
jgi:hypothetical protein